LFTGLIREIATVKSLSGATLTIQAKYKAKIGDSGIGSTLECTDGTKSKTSWVLVTKNNATALKVTEINYDVSDEISSQSTEYYFITTNGTIKKWSLSEYLNNEDVTLTVPTTTVNLR